MRFYVTAQLGPKQSMTPEGFLLCEDVPVARVGEMIYGPNETPVSVDPQTGVVRISRDPDQVFRPETIFSCAGKPITLDHPPEDVTPANWRKLAYGVMINPRRGEGDNQDVILVDLIITDPEMIADVRAGKREVSLGYDAEYDEIAPGVGRQRDIIVNHVALVERGRCGPRCSIGDHRTLDALKETDMAAKTQDRRTAFFDKLRTAFKSKDAEEFEKEIKKAEDADPEKEGEKKDDKAKDAEPGIHLHVGGNDDVSERISKLEEGQQALTDSMTKVADSVAKINDKLSGKDAEGEANTKLEGNLQAEAPPGTGDKASKAKDSEYLGDAFQETVALAEVLAPGIRMPTYDRAMAPAKTFDAICGLRRQALDLAYARPMTRGIIDDVLGSGKSLDTKAMTCDAARTLFRAAGAAAKIANNATAKTTDTRNVNGKTAMPIKTPADLNRRMAELYK